VTLILETPMQAVDEALSLQNYTVKVPGGERQLLNDVDGYCKPGQLTALMGASGAGKVSGNRKVQL
jgi:ATP-binding cassette subfamily G (WHITE) protein 2 (SNQ2)